MIICPDVIEHLINPDNLLRLIKQIANQNTHIVISTPDRDKLRGESCMKSNKKEHIREWNFNEFRTYIDNSGLKNIEHFNNAPLKLSIYSWRDWLFHKTRGNNDGMEFKWNQVLHCKLI